MKTFRKILSFLKNRYVLTLAIVVTWLLFFDRNDVFSQYQRHQDVKKLEAEYNYYETQIANNKREGNSQIDLQNFVTLL